MTHKHPLSMCGYDLYGPMSQSSLVQFIRQRNRFIIYSVQVVQTFSILGNHLTHKSIQFVIVTVLLSRRRSLAPPLALQPPHCPAADSGLLGRYLLTGRGGSLPVHNFRPKIEYQSGHGALL